MLRSLLDADMLTKSSAASKPGVGGGVASGLGAGVASGAYCFKHASVQAVAEHVLSQELKLKLHRAAARDYEAQYAALPDKHEARPPYISPVSPLYLPCISPISRAPGGPRDIYLPMYLPM